ncbi:electron transport complex subunit RsxC [Morganella morganii]|uniref:electron transport complex subunit RsxC n=1 Tax=Morganella morganii TaxID=582 RepID=UPI001C785986|nr:electron transport complex subunit RsxC [Morganella morganii]QXO41142.1 electron transport complex subunit RsxC [Morganella morganii]
MFNLLNFLKKDRVWDFDGGIHPPEMKLQSSRTPMRVCQVPVELIIPLQQHIGNEGDVLVSPGDHVLKGQPLTRGTGRSLPVHASSSGTVTAVEPCVTAHPSGLTAPCVRIRTDGLDTPYPAEKTTDFTSLTKTELTDRIHQAGIAGLGGAGFPTANKLKGGGDLIRTLIINAAECEPYITADDRLMQEHAGEILTGIRILMHLLEPEQVLIGIEDNKPEAIAALRDVTDGEKQIFVRVIPTKYPSGGAKQLTKILTGREVPSGGRSSDIGVLMQNVGTVVAIKRAITDGEPLIQRVVTVTGEAVESPGNFWTRLGTPIRFLLQQAGFHPQHEQMVVMGGPLMGFTLPDLDVPVVKITNCILAPTTNEMEPAAPEEACIRCSHCVDACPAGLLPQQLYWFSKGNEHEKAEQHHLFDCIECGACAWVCPSNIPLVQYYRQEKAQIIEIREEAQRAADAKIRFEAKQARMAREKEARENRHKNAAVQVDEKDSAAISAALARVKAKDSSAGMTISVNPSALPDNSAAIAAREARKAQARARQAEKAAQAADAPADTVQPAAETETDPRKAAVAAAIARAKAKKAAQAAEAPADTVQPAAETETDPRKAAVAAAIARAKAKKAAQAADAPADTAQPAAETETDPRKAAVAAAIARAKAKKAAQAADAPADTAQPAAETETDPRKAAVAAAIARAKAKKAAQAADAPADTAQPAAEAEADPRKAAVAAAIARAKAKKAAQAAEAPADTAQPAAETETDPRKAAVAAAIARAKAKKAAQAAEAPADTVQPAAETETDPRKAAVAAAIARVKAKKAAQAAEAPADTVQPAAETETDPRKAAVAAAIARVKAKKAAQAAAQHSEETTD